MHIIDPDEVAKVLGIPWEQTKDMEDSVINENEYHFCFPGGQVLTLNHNKPNEVSFWCNAHGYTTDNIGFHSITRVAYSKERQAIAFESVDENYFSDMIIKANGKFGLEIGKPMKLYKASFCEIISKE